ncbi:anthranilate phosphoribosyltransferase [Nitrospirillum amazonense]|uniref:Anthranilate phosphoribosyltransferase n=1 Tax=Nitrospirillum amazonense TaxID=28077 RepID=A0A560K3A3_9PROT|nr:glycosyl transferase family protein [Nitrospirillum amazonense]TWB77716.1 anthranilate phosphoribosyltransferase [Nitrospirillum amazonense]
MTDEHVFAQYVRTLGRGPGRSRSLTREEARTALGMVLKGEADPHQVGAFLMLLRYRGEDPDEVAGLVEAARDAAGISDGACTGAADLDWPSYGAGRTRDEPWFLLSALALAQAGHRVIMHGSNAFTQGRDVPDALGELGLRPATSHEDAKRLVAETGFAYLPLSALSPALDHLLNLRHLLGLRSPINTVCRLLDPFHTQAAVDGVFHPPYIDLHLGVAQRLNRPRLVVVKGGGGEVERNPAKPTTAYLQADAERWELPLPALTASKAEVPGLLPVWRGEPGRDAETATVIATIALGVLALGLANEPAEADRVAAEIWAGRRASPA